MGGTAVLGCDPVILPIELYSFTGYNEGIKNILNWKTASEINNDYFTIERSNDGINWLNIGQVKGAGNSTKDTKYQYKDVSYHRNTINYYRLSQTDFNGKKEVFNIIAIDNNKDNATVVRITNLMGQIVDRNYKGLVIIHYSNGDIEKTVQY